MTVLSLSQWQFAITAVYHFFFVPLTLGLSLLTAVMETIYVNSGQTVYKAMAKFWGKLFLINFAMGVVTGIVMEFEFGMNWSEYSRFVGDIFGAPLAIEALTAFFLESIFIGVWIFGWNRLSKGVHLLSIWLVALAVNISSLWILIANSFMQEPVGYRLENGRAVMSNFFELLANPNVWVQFPHTALSGFTTGAFFVMGISAYHLVRKQNVDFFRRSFTIGAVAGIIAIFLVILVGHSQAQQMVRTQPMKMASAEALWNTENPASFSLITIGNEPEHRDVFAIRIPRMLSLLAYNRLDGEVKGINDLQKEYEQTYGPGNYAPPIAVTYLSFRLMVGAGFLMLFLAAYGLFHATRNTRPEKIRFLKWFPFTIALPYLANTTGWMMTELGRQPWVVFGLMKTEKAFSPTLTPGMVLASLIVLTLLYGALMAADIYLLVKYAKAGPQEPSRDETSVEAIAL
ncbi:MAG TPA: cytochrome ubiquinol oxidase subunit I [Anaerolineaceae bacterium]|nr:cytochrome ubiquinol oxidase subunit I [Anaerolineaceae bacterium]